MVAFSDVSSPVAKHTPQRGRRARRRKSGSRALAGLARFAGVVLMLASVGIWILTAPLWDAGMMLLRLAVSALFLCLGLLMLQAGRAEVRDEVHLDRRARELRHVQRGHDGIARIRHRYALADLGAVTVSDDQLIITDRNGDVLMELSGLAHDQLQLIDREMRKI